MSKLPNWTSKQLIKFLKKNGFILDHSTGSHYIFYHPFAKKRIVVPFHTSNLPKGTLRAILRQAGISKNETGQK